MYVQTILMSIFKRLNWFNLEIHEVGHQEFERLTVDKNVISH
jgi:hypothetical protein